MKRIFRNKQKIDSIHDSFDHRGFVHNSFFTGTSEERDI